MDLGSGVIISGQTVKDAPLGCDWHALLPSGVTSIYAKLCWKDADALRNNASPNPDSKRKRKVTIIDGGPSPSDFGAGHGLIANYGNDTN